MFMRTHVSRRAIRDDSGDEMEAFVRWVGRQPLHTNPKINVVYDIAALTGMSVERSDDEGDDDEDEDDY